MSVLEGGLGAWQANKFPTEKGPAQPADVSIMFLNISHFLAEYLQSKFSTKVSS